MEALKPSCDGSPRLSCPKEIKNCVKIKHGVTLCCYGRVHMLGGASAKSPGDFVVTFTPVYFDPLRKHGVSWAVTLPYSFFSRTAMTKQQGAVSRCLHLPSLTKAVMPDGEI